MMTVQQAFDRARAFAKETLGDFDYTLEELERDTYKGHEVWCVTLGFPTRKSKPSQEIGRMFGGQYESEYKTFLVNLESGDVDAMRIRELAS